MSEDAEEYAREIALMAYFVAPTLKPKAYLAHEICDLSLHGGISTRHNPEIKLASKLLLRNFSNPQKFGI